MKSGVTTKTTALAVIGQHPTGVTLAGIVPYDACLRGGYGLIQWTSAIATKVPDFSAKSMSVILPTLKPT